MVAMRKMTVEVPEDVARRLEARLAAGDYESQSAIVTASLEAQLEADDRSADWATHHLGAALGEWRQAPERVTPMAEVFDGALARYEARKAGER